MMGLLFAASILFGACLPLVAVHSYLWLRATLENADTSIELTQRGTEYYLIQAGELVAIIEFSPTRITVRQPACVRAIDGKWTEYVGPVDCKEE